MNKSLSQPRVPVNSLSARSKVKSTTKEIRSLTKTREIVINTNEPDLPLITILKV